MRIRKANPAKLILLTNIYRKKTLEEIQSIKTQWACGLNEKHLLKVYLHSSLKEYSIFFVNLKELISKVDFGEMGSKKLNPFVLFTGVDLSDQRIASTLNHWNRGKFVDPPILAVNSFNILYISDGRHRTIAAFHIGEKNIPVAIDNASIKDVASRISLEKIKS